jgi:hypothetical protein
MRGGLALAAAVIVLTASGARAEDWCGSAAHAKSIVECGYSTVTQCESALGKGGVCFVDPETAFNTGRPATATAVPAIGTKAPAGDADL